MFCNKKLLHLNNQNQFIMKLLPMTDFVLQQEKDISKFYAGNRIINYAKLLKKPRELGMFAPIDDNGIVMENPECDCYTEYDREGCPDKCYEYINAMNRVLFLTSIDLDAAKHHVSQNRTVEYFTGFNVELTESAIKQLGL